jgi:hypothetical protein
MYFYRGKAKCSYKELFNLDLHFATFIYQGLVQVKASGRYGIPYIFMQAPYNLNKEDAEALWSSILDDMIFAFTPEQDYSQIEAPLYRINTLLSPRVNGRYKCQVERVAIGSATQDDIQAYEARRTAWEKDYYQQRAEGRLLFAKYFDYLHIH